VDQPQSVLSAEDFQQLQKDVAPEHHAAPHDESAEGATTDTNASSPLMTGGGHHAHHPHDEDQHYVQQHDEHDRAGASLALTLGGGHDTAGSASSGSGGASGGDAAVNDPHQAISFCQALLIPGVIPNALCLFFSKLVTYAFLFWLPLYLSTLDYCPNQAGRVLGFHVFVHSCACVPLFSLSRLG
jgi:hypothetical protein